MKNLIPVILLTVLIHQNINAQTKPSYVINSTGGSFEKGNNTYEWSIGELALVNEMQSTNGQLIFTNGFLQSSGNAPYIPNTTPTFTGKQVVVLPNPTSDFVKLYFSIGQVGRLRISMYNELGVTVYKNEIFLSGNESNEIIRMYHLKNGSYMLHVEFSGTGTGVFEKKKTYKIIKTS